MKKLTLALAILTLAACNNGRPGPKENDAPADPTMVNASGSCTQRYIDMTKSFVEKMNTLNNTKNLPDESMATQSNDLCQAHIQKTKNVKCNSSILLNGEKNPVNALDEQGLINQQCARVAGVYAKFLQRNQVRSVSIQHADELQKINARLTQIGCKTSVSDHTTDADLTWSCKPSRDGKVSEEKLVLLKQLHSEFDPNQVTTDFRDAESQSLAEIETTGHNLNEIEPLKQKLSKVYGYILANVPPMLTDDSMTLDGLLKLEAIAKKHKIHIPDHQGLFISNYFYDKSLVGLTIDGVAPIDKIEEYLRKNKYILD